MTPNVTPNETPNKSRGTVLIVDDELYVRDSLAAVLSRRGFTVATASSPDSALATLAALAPGGSADVVVTDLKMPGGPGLELVRQLVQHPERADTPAVIVLTAYGTVNSAVECMRAGACDYLLKPVQADELVTALERALGRRSGRRRPGEATLAEPLPAVASPPAPGLRPLLGDSPGWREALAQIERTARADTPVLLLGETGTGKEELAHRLHHQSARRGGPMVAVNCAALPAELFESEMFGHRRGAFTGAVGDRQGRFAAAHRGTLFLDEIDSLPLAGQAKILRVLQDGVFELLGESQPSAVDVRLVAASNADLGAEVAAGRFRADLFFRVNVMTLEIPPLRARREDIPALAAGFLAELAPRLAPAVERLHPETLAVLLAYRWPGNVRELRNVIERGLLLCPGHELLPAHLPPALRAAEPLPAAAPRSLRQALNEAERQLLAEALHHSRGRRREAARQLGVDERNLAYYLKKHGLDKPPPQP